MESVPGDFARTTAYIIVVQAEACANGYKVLGDAIRPKIHMWLRNKLRFTVGSANETKGMVRAHFDMRALISDIHEKHNIPKSAVINFIENELSSTMSEAEQYTKALYMVFDNINSLLMVTVCLNTTPVVPDDCLLVPPTDAAKAVVLHDGGALPRPDLDKMPATPVEHRSPPPAPRPKRARSNPDFTSDDNK